MPIADADITVAEIVVRQEMTFGAATVKTMLNVFHFRRTNTPAAANKGNVAGAFSAQVVTPWLLLVNAALKVATISVRWLDDVEDQYNDTTVNNVGNVAGDPLSMHSAAMLHFKTGLRGRSRQGSKHFGGMSESDCTTYGDTWNAGALTRIGDVADAIEAGFTEAGGNVWVPCIVSRIHSQLATNPTFIEKADVTQIRVNKTVGTMKHRKARSSY